MKTLLLILSIAFFASCSTAYKSGQTPDDVYYSKSKVVVNSEDRYEKEVYRYDDRQIRMSAYDPRWRNLDYDYDYDWRYNPYAYGYNYGYYYNPYYYAYPVYACGTTFVNPKNTTIRKANLAAYNNTVTTYTPTKGSGTVRTVNTRRYNNTNYEPSRNTNNETRTYTEPRSETRTYSPPPSNNNSSTPSKGTSVPMPSRGGN
jgi:hypothetical protein